MFEYGVEYMLTEDTYLVLKKKGIQEYKSPAGKAYDNTGSYAYRPQKFIIAMDFPDDLRHLFIGSYGTDSVGILESYSIRSI